MAHQINQWFWIVYLEFCGVEISISTRNSIKLNPANITVSLSRYLTHFTQIWERQTLKLLYIVLKPHTKDICTKRLITMERIFLKEIKRKSLSDMFFGYADEVPTSKGSLNIVQLFTKFLPKFFR